MKRPSKASQSVGLGAAILFALISSGAAMAEAPVEAKPSGDAVRLGEAEILSDAELEALAIERERLLAALKATRSEADAAPIVSQLWRNWRTGPDILATGLLKDAMAHIRVADAEGALAILDQVTRDYPDWAEGWNARATLHFHQGRYDASLADIERTLTLEPAHFGALAGRALIHIEAGRFVEAREAIKAAMAINPWVNERHLLTQLPEEERI